MHQFSLDRGSWRTAWALTLLREPYERKEFAGDEVEMDTITAMLESKRKLADKVGGGAPAQDEDEDDDPEKPEARKKGKPKAKAKG